MRDPYQVLGVPSTATDEEVKKAYRDLARKYHPDNYHDNPLADLAQERMKEINEAYEAVQSQRKAQRSGGYSASGAGYGTGYGGYQSAYQGSYQGSSRYQRVRMAISSGDLNLAEELLNAQTNHDAEWNFLKGAICYRRGWLDEARRYYQTAVTMAPDNPEYPGDWIQYPNLNWLQPTFPSQGTACALRRDAPLTLRFRVVVLSGDTDATTLQRFWADYAEAKK